MVAFMAIALMIAKDEIPQVADFIDRLVDKESWQAADLCRNQALQASMNPDFARIVDGGKVDTTQNGFYVHDITIGEMSNAGGNEQLYSFSCYVSSAGDIVKTHKD